MNHLVAYGATQFNRYGHGLIAAGIDYIVVNAKVVFGRIIRWVFECIVQPVEQVPTLSHADAHVVHTGLLMLPGDGWRRRRRNADAAGGIGRKRRQRQPQGQRRQPEGRQKDAGPETVHGRVGARTGALGRLSIRLAVQEHYDAGGSVVSRRSDGHFVHAGLVVVVFIHWSLDIEFCNAQQGRLVGGYHGFLAESDAGTNRVPTNGITAGYQYGRRGLYVGYGGRDDEVHGLGRPRFGNVVE